MACCLALLHRSGRRADPPQTRSAHLEIATEFGIPNSVIRLITRVVGSIGRESSDGRLYPFDHRHADGRVVAGAVGEFGSNDEPLTVDREMQLTLAASLV
ncbi:MAG: hypothetical protein ACI9OJ_005268 [Myxococcota bacterium]|jgi:hypothetical protein